MRPDSDEQVQLNANYSDSNNNNSSTNVNNYFDNNKFRNNRLDERILEPDDEEEEDDNQDEDDQDYSDYEEDIEEFASSGDLSVNNSTVSSVGEDSSSVDSSSNSTTESLPLQEQLVQPDQIRNVVDESTSPAVSSATEESMDEMSDAPRTEALIGIRPFAEGSGNGRRGDDDEDDDDYDDDEDTDIVKARKRIKNARENQEKGGSRRFNNYNGNLEEDESDEDGSSRFMKNRRFGKNNAIKFISTPHGKVGILYSSSDEAKRSNGASSSSSNNSPTMDIPKDIFRGISSDLRPILISNADAREDRNSAGGSSGKMTPVLTADGKVALLYRGASAENENVAKKYEPIVVNYTKPIAAPHPETNLDEEEESDSREDKKDDNVDSHQELPRNSIAEHPMDSGETERQEDGIAVPQPAAIPPPPPPPRLEDNNFLPILDRPLSELLGLKKHQFTHFRVTEPTTTTPVPHVNMRGKLPSNYDYDFGAADYNGVSDQEILTKTDVVNLAIVPSLTQEHNSAVHQKGSVHFRKPRRFRLEDLSNIHCAMQAMVGVAALACIFGMLGAYFKNRILDTQVPAYRL